MEWEDIKNKNEQELNELLSESRLELHGLKQQAHNRQLKQFHKINDLKKVIARVSTVLQNKKPAVKI